MYWYHPHPHQLTAEQVARGLAGVFIVRPRIDPLPGGIDEHVLMVTDLRVDATGTMMGWTAADMMNGREGDHLLINGRRNPVLDAAPGATLRLRLVNATSARYVRLALDGASMTLIGTDGGLMAAPVPINELLLAPAERIDVIAQMPASTAMPIALRLLPHDRGWMMMSGMASAPMLNQDALLTIRLQGSQKPAVKLPALLRSIAPLPAPIASKQLVLTERVSMMTGAGMMSGGTMGWQFVINGRLFDPNRVDLVSNAGDVEQWELVNASSMDHPIHIHGTQFQVVERDVGGVRTPAAYLAWKDTVNVPRATTVRLRVRQTMPGLRMFHCHILEHEDQGMMGVLRVQ
jgi:bilirubin oxidase